MAQIKVLDKQVAELIAAGEVIDRPASVIKELVENSIDAGANVITVEVQNGGVTLMRVTDNGCGMDRTDVSTAFLRHATSKIRAQDDLEQIGTLGFRGEALASIAAVAQVELITKTQGALAGVRYCIHGGEAQLQEDCGCPTGSTITVKNLFYNVPARMKFLKKDTVEANAVCGVMDKIALSHPEISFRVLRDGKEVLHTPGDGQLKSAVYAVYGREFTAGLIPVDYTHEHVKVQGFVSKPAAARPNRSMQNFFINGRYIKSKTAMVALEQAFKGALMVGKFPSCVLQITLAFGAVDVNVHPNKLEVRFINEKPIFDAVYYGVKTALQQGDEPSVMQVTKTVFKPSLEQPIKSVQQMQLPAKPRVVQSAQPKEQPVQPASGFAGAILHQKPVKTIELQDSVAKQPFLSHAIDIVAEDNESAPQLQQKSEQPPKPLQPEAVLNNQPLRLVGEVFGTYILAERSKEELVMIDKHAAHERMLYKKLKQQGIGAAAQMLLTPLTVTLEKEEYVAVLQAVELFAQAGFELEDFGAGTILVRSAPLSLEKDDVQGAVMEMAGYLSQGKTDLTTEHLDWLYHNIACRAAMKAGDKSAPQELLALVEQLEDDDGIRYCPHGRPVKIIIRKKDLEKQFGRIP